MCLAAQQRQTPCLNDDLGFSVMLFVSSSQNTASTGIKSMQKTEGRYRKPFIRKSQKPAFHISLARAVSHDHPVVRGAERVHVCHCSWWKRISISDEDKEGYVPVADRGHLPQGTISVMTLVLKGCILEVRDVNQLLTVLAVQRKIKQNSSQWS